MRKITKVETSVIITKLEIIVVQKDKNNKSMKAITKRSNDQPCV